MDLEKAKISYTVGLDFFKKGKFELALLHFNKALNINPNYSEVLSDKGAVLAKLERYEESLETLNKALKLDPYLTNAIKNKNFVLKKLGKKPEEEKKKEPIVRRVYVGQKMFVPFDVGIHGLRNVYRSFDDVIEKHIDMNKLTVRIPFYANIKSSEMFDMFIYEILNFLSNSACLKEGDSWGEEEKASKAWKQIDKSTATQYEKTQEINLKIWEKLSPESYDKNTFVELMKELENDFAASIPPLQVPDYKNFYESVITNIDEYYSYLPSFCLENRYGIAFDAEICTFLPTQERVKLSDLPLDLQENIEGLELQTLNGEECLKGCYAFAFDLHNSNDYTLKLIRAEDYLNIKQIIISGSVSAGFPCKIPSMFPGPAEHSIRPILLTDINSKRLSSRIVVTDGKIVDRGPKWWNNEEIQKDNYLTTKDGINCGIKAVNVLITRFGNTYRIIRTDNEYVSYELMSKL